MTFKQIDISEDYGSGGTGGGADSVGTPYGNVAPPAILDTAINTVITRPALDEISSLTTPTSQLTALAPELTITPIVADIDQVIPVQKEYLTLQVAKEGFGSYLDGILPDEIAIAAGAFSASMQNVKNILNVDFEKFAQVAFAIETTKGLDLINGTDVPANVALANLGYLLTALGSGPNGTYTMSDMFGCMSGLPYPWESLQQGIIDLQTTKLKNIYDQLYLAVTWEPASISISQTVTMVNVQPYIPPDPISGDPGQPRIDNWYYTVDFSLADNGGGYYRGTAITPPTVSFTPNNCGASATVNIGTDLGTKFSNLGSDGEGTYGRVTGFATKNTGLASPGYLYDTTSVSQSGPPPQPPPPVEYVTIQTPPTATLPVSVNGSISTSGVNTSPGKTNNTSGGSSLSPAGWSGPDVMNPVVAAYIAQANEEIAVIRTTRPIAAVNLNTLHRVTGSQLAIEQRARFAGIAPVPQGARDNFLNLYPSALMVFVDQIPILSKNTLPHMQVQTLEAISNLDLAEGQSIVGMMRQERNAARLEAIGANQDNVMPALLDPAQALSLLLNGTTAATMPNDILQDYNFPSETPPAGVAAETTTPKAVGLTKPAYQQNKRDKVVIKPQPLGYFDGSKIVVTPNKTPGDPNNLVPIVKLQNVSNPPVGPGIINTPGIPETLPSTLFPGIFGPGPNNLNQFGPAPNVVVPYPTAGSIVPTGPGVPLDVGKAPPGSLAPSKAINLLPPNLKFAASTLLPSTFDVPEAIDEVIKCNCDCWVQ